MNGEHTNKPAHGTEDLQLKRYDCFYRDQFGDAGAALSEADADGEWVRYEDVKGVLAFIGGYLMEHRGMLEDLGAHKKVLDAVRHLETEIEKL